MARDSDGKLVLIEDLVIVQYVDSHEQYNGNTDTSQSTF